MNAPLLGQLAHDLACPRDTFNPAVESAYCHQAAEHAADPIKGAGFINGEFTDECDRILSLLDTDPAKAAALWRQLKDRAFLEWAERKASDTDQYH